MSVSIRLSICGVRYAQIPQSLSSVPFYKFEAEFFHSISIVRMIIFKNINLLYQILFFKYTALCDTPLSI